MTYIVLGGALNSTHSPSIHYFDSDLIEDAIAVSLSAVLCV